MQSVIRLAGRSDKSTILVSTVLALACGLFFAFGSVTYSADTGVHLQIDTRCLIREYGKRLWLRTNVFTHAIIDVEEVRSCWQHHPKVAVLIGRNARDFLLPILCQDH